MIDLQITSTTLLLHLLLSEFVYLLWKKNKMTARQFGGKMVYLFNLNSNQLDPFASELTS